MDSVSNQFKSSLSKQFRKEGSSMISGENPLPIEDFGKMMSSLSSAQKEVKEEDYDEFFEEISKEETKEATGAGSAGGFEAPLFSEPKKNNLFQPGTETKLTTKPKGGFVNEDEISGGLADGMTLEDLADYHDTTINDLIEKVSQGVNVEMEHTSDMSVAIEIAMDHIYEDLNYYSKLKR